MPGTVVNLFSYRTSLISTIVGRQSINLDPFQEELTRLYEAGLSYSELVRYLAEEYEVSVTDRTIKRRFRVWNIRRYERRDASDELKRRIQVLFFEIGLNDQDILHVLQQEGYSINQYSLVRLRFTLNLRRSLRTEEQRAQADIVVRRLIQEELQKGVIDGYGRGYLYTHFRQQGHIIARDRLFQAYRTILPEQVDRRRRKMQQHRGEYIVPGPNFIWSIDGYDKLKPYGIQIYACIDAFSRYVIWIYVGISNATAISCLSQYLECLALVEQQPRFVRSDRGGETIMLADAHFQLQHNQQSDVRFEDCYLYGTSTANQRIEAWWNQMTKGLLFKWRVCDRTTKIYI